MPKQARIPNVKFNLKRLFKKDDKRSAKEECLIKMIFRYNGNRLVLSTREKVISKYWNNKINAANNVRNHPEYVRLNERLNDLAKITRDIFEEHNCGEIEVPEFKNEIAYRMNWKERPKEETDHLTFFEFADKYLNERKNMPNAKRGTWKNLLTTLNLLRDYDKERKQKEPLNYNDFDFNFKQSFEAWLYKEPRLHSTNYASKKLAILRQFLHEATKREYNSNMTFAKRGWSIKKEKVQKISLTFAQLDKLYNLDLSDNPRLERARDLILIGSYCGLRYSDYNRLKPEHIIEHEGVEMIELYTKKTDTQVIIPLFPELKEMLAKYDYNPPKLSNQRLNQYFKEIGRLAGLTDVVEFKTSVGGEIIKKQYELCDLLSSHVCRRSFLTNFYNLGIPAGKLMLISGHQTEKNFFLYINSDKKDNAKELHSKITELISKRKLRVV